MRLKTMHWRGLCCDECFARQKVLCLETYCEWERHSRRDLTGFTLNPLDQEGCAFIAVLVVLTLSNSHRTSWENAEE